MQNNWDLTYFICFSGLFEYKKCKKIAQFAQLIIQMSLYL